MSTPEEQRPGRTVKVIARAAADLQQAASWTGPHTPYLKLELAGTTVATQPNTDDPINPVFNETFVVELPPPSPAEIDQPFVLRVAAKNAARLLPDRLLGAGTAPLAQLLVAGSEEARVPLHDAAGKPAGVVHVAARVEAPPAEAPIPSAAGTVLGEVPREPVGPAAAGKAGPDIVPTTQAGPPTPLVGAVAPGASEDPSTPAYGILRG